MGWRGRGALGAVSAVVALGVWLRHSFVVVTVAGASMEPAYRDGDRVLVLRRRPGGPRPGQVVVLAPARVADPGESPASGAPSRRSGTRTWLVKRVCAGPGDRIPGGLGPALADVAGTMVPPGRMVILGDNLARSHDSRHDGLLPVTRVRGVVLRPLPNPGPD